MRNRQLILFTGLGMVIGALSMVLFTALFSAPEPYSPPLTAPRFSSLETLTPTPEKTVQAQEASHNASQSPTATTPTLVSLPMSDTPPSDPAETPDQSSASQEDKTIVVEKGDTLLGVLIKAGVEQKEAHESIESVQKVYNPRQLRSGDKVTVTFSVGDDIGFQGFSLSPDPARKVFTSRNADGEFSTIELMATLREETLRFEGEIESSLSAAANQAGVPAGVLAEVIKLFSFDVDFQRDIQKGDRFALLFKRTITPSGEAVGSFELMFASLTLSGTENALYRYVDKDGIVDYYNSKGESVRKALLRTPINGARLSSGFGVRKHPVLGFSRMHKGVDFAAPTGTPILAAGDGVVKIAKVQNGYGNYVRLQHTPEWETAYAHLSSYGHGIKPGVKVRQGDVIGYVGSTGLATGPHLHYEILKAGVQVNPVGVRFPTGRKLAGTELTHFKSRLAQTQSTYASLKPGEGRIAQISSKSAKPQ